MVFSCLRATSFGSFAVIWSKYKGQPKIIRIFFSSPRISAKRKMVKYFPHAKVSSHVKINKVVNQIVKFLKGKHIRFPLSAIRLDRCSAFQQKVLRATYAISRGKVSTYGHIAKRIGHPHAGRAVGTALARNHFPIIIPCHRVIRSGGGLGGFQNGSKMKRGLLEREGIRFRHGKRVATTHFLYGEKRRIL